MAWYLVVLILIVKHALLSHILDFGYSLARAPVDRLWPLGLFGQLLFDLSISFFILALIDYPYLLLALLLEAIVLTTTCLLERSATYHNMLRRHVLGEAALITAYVLISFG